jgi:hypothetical protein
MSNVVRPEKWWRISSRSRSKEPSSRSSASHCIKREKKKGETQEKETGKHRQQCWQAMRKSSPPQQMADAFLDAANDNDNDNDNSANSKPKCHLHATQVKKRVEPKTANDNDSDKTASMSHLALVN